MPWEWIVLMVIAFLASAFTGEIAYRIGFRQGQRANETEP